MADDELRIRTSIDNTAEEGLKRLEAQARRTTAATGEAAAGGTVRGGSAPRSSIEEYQMRKARAEQEYYRQQQSSRILRMAGQMDTVDPAAVMGRDARMAERQAMRDQAASAARLRNDILARAKEEAEADRAKERAAKEGEKIARAEQRAAEEMERARQRIWGIGGGNLGVMTGMGALFGGMQVARVAQDVLRSGGGFDISSLGQMAGGIMQMIPIPAFQLAGMGLSGLSGISGALRDAVVNAYMPKEVDFSIEGRRQLARDKLAQAAKEFDELGGESGPNVNMSDPDATIRAKRNQWQALKDQIDRLQTEIQDPFAYAMQMSTEVLMSVDPEFRKKHMANEMRRLARNLRDKGRRGLEPLGLQRANELFAAADEFESGGRDWGYELSGAGARFRRPLSLREVGRAIPSRDSSGQLHVTFDFSGTEGPLSAAVAAAIRPVMERAFGGRRQ